jgi:hypothetical protein
MGEETKREHGVRASVLDHNEGQARDPGSTLGLDVNDVLFAR